MLGIVRNPYDRVVHLGVGLLISYVLGTAAFLVNEFVWGELTRAAWRMRVAVAAVNQRCTTQLRV